MLRLHSNRYAQVCHLCPVSARHVPWHHNVSMATDSAVILTESMSREHVTWFVLKCLLTHGDNNAKHRHWAVRVNHCCPPRDISYLW